MTPSIKRVSTSLVIGCAAICGLTFCGDDQGSQLGGGDGGSDGGGDETTFNNADGGTEGGIHTNYKCPSCPAFPPLPAPACDPSVLGPAAIAYPLDGTLLPPNMNVLEVQFVPPAKATLYEVDFENGITDVRVETLCAAVPDVRKGASKGCGVTLPQAAWNDIANANREGNPVSVIVRATIDGQCVSSSTTKVDLSYAKEDLAGGIYYWQSAVYGGIGGKTGGIYSHDFGTFDPTPTPFYTSGSSGTCVGCHNVSRDGVHMALATDDPDGDDEFGDVHTLVLDVATRTAVGGATMSPGFQTFTHDHSKMISSSFKSQKDFGFDIFDGNGKTLLASAKLPANMLGTQPDLSRDDGSLVFVVPPPMSIPSAGDHHFNTGALYGSTFTSSSNTIGAPSLLLADNTRNYYYPSFSPNGTFIVFNDAPQPGNTPTTNNDAFYNRGARVKLIHNPPGNGAKPIDLQALNQTGDLTNSWPRWSPFVQQYKGHKLLWVTFSSNRDYGLHLSNKGFDNCYPPASPLYDQPQPLSKQNTTYENCAEPQIWMAAINVDESTALDSSDRSYPAFWLPFQDVNSHNHSAQWVEKVQGTPPPGSDAGGCVQTLGTCNGNNLCCNGLICCNGVCGDGSGCIPN